MMKVYMWHLCRHSVRHKCRTWYLICVLDADEDEEDEDDEEEADVSGIWFILRYFFILFFVSDDEVEDDDEDENDDQNEISGMTFMS